jgi:hypothetical protein
MKHKELFNYPTKESADLAAARIAKAFPRKTVRIVESRIPGMLGKYLIEINGRFAMKGEM